MERNEAERRMTSARNILLDHGWTETQLERAFDGLMLEETLEKMERAAKDALGMSDEEASWQEALAEHDAAVRRAGVV